MGKPALNTLTRGRLTAYPHDNVLRWRVQSNSRPDIEHVVDLGTWHGNGSCSCEHFEFRLAPLLRDGIGRAGKATRCGHIMVAREAFANHMIQILSAKAAELARATEPCPECQGDAEDIEGNPCPCCEGAGAISAA